MTQVTSQPFTAEALLALDDGFRYELVRGELRKMSLAESAHGYLTGELSAELRNHVKAHKLGRVYAAETGFKLTSNPDTVRAPDVAFVSQERLERTGPVTGYWPGAPDLAAEVVSPSDTYSGVEEKVFEWLNHGARLVLVVNPLKKTVTVYRSSADITHLTEEDVLEGGDVVPGWTLLLKDFFA